MPQVNITAATGQELRQLLDASRRRGDAALSYKILQEMAARRDTPAKRLQRLTRRPAEPRNIDVDFSDPVEEDDVPPMPHWPPAAHDIADLAAPPLGSLAAPDQLQDFDRPLNLQDADPEPRLGAEEDPWQPAERFQPVELGAPLGARRSRFRLLAGLVLGAALGIAVGWLGGWLARDGMSRTVAPIAAPFRTAALTPPPTVPPPSQPAASQAAEPVPEASSETPIGPAAQDPAPAAKITEPDPTPDGTATELPAPGPERRTADAAKTAATPEPPSDIPAPAAASGCASAATPADRTICGHPELRRLQVELRRAYEQALAAHQDRALLRQHQLEWRDARSAVEDPDRLAQLYEERIRKLNAATAQARRGRSGPGAR